MKMGSAVAVSLKLSVAWWLALSTTCNVCAANMTGNADDLIRVKHSG